MSITWQTCARSEADACARDGCDGTGWIDCGVGGTGAAERATSSAPNVRLARASSIHPTTWLRQCGFIEPCTSSTYCGFARQAPRSSARMSLTRSQREKVADTVELEAFATGAVDSQEREGWQARRRRQVRKATRAGEARRRTRGGGSGSHPFRWSADWTGMSRSRMLAPPANGDHAARAPQRRGRGGARAFQ